MIMEERIPQVLFLIQLKRWIFCFLFFGKLVTLNFERFLFWSCVRYPLKVDTSSSNVKKSKHQRFGWIPARKPPGMGFTPTLINHGDFNGSQPQLVRKFSRISGCHPTVGDGSEISMIDRPLTQFLWEYHILWSHVGCWSTCWAGIRTYQSFGSWDTKYVGDTKYDV